MARVTQYRPAEFSEPDVEEEWGEADDIGDSYPPHHCERWTAGHDQFLRTAFGKVTISKIAEELGRTPYAIVCRFHKLGLVTDEQRDVYRTSGVLVPVVYRGMVLYGDSRTPDTSLPYDTEAKVIDWLRDFNIVGEAKCLLFRLVGDRCKSEFIPHSRIHPQLVTRFKIEGVINSDRRIPIHGEQGRRNLEAALGEAFDGVKSLRLDHVTTDESLR